LMEEDDDVNVEVPCPPPRRFSFSMIVWDSKASK
jgi:hypothetical protein